MDGSYQIIRIQRYLNGELSKAEMYELERDALDDAFLQDALDGYREAKVVDHGKLSFLQQRLAMRVDGLQERRNSFFFGVQRLAIAATAFVLFVTVCILFWMRTQIRPGELSTKEVEVELNPVGERAAVGAQPSVMGGADAEPIGGWNGYNEYLSVNIGSTSFSGVVVLAFEVDREGQPSQIQVMEAANGSIADEAQRLLKAGPRWTGQQGGVTFTFSP